MTDHYAKAVELLDYVEANHDAAGSDTLAAAALAHATLAAAGMPRPRRIVATPAPARRKAGK